MPPFWALAANTAIKIAGSEVGLFKDKAEFTHKIDFDDLTDGSQDAQSAGLSWGDLFRSCFFTNRKRWPSIPVSPHR